MTKIEDASRTSNKTMVTPLVPSGLPSLLEVKLPASSEPRAPSAQGNIPPDVDHHASFNASGRAFVHAFGPTSVRFKQNLHKEIDAALMVGWRSAIVTFVHGYQIARGDPTIIGPWHDRQDKFISAQRKIAAMLGTPAPNVAAALRAMATLSNKLRPEAKGDEPQSYESQAKSCMANLRAACVVDRLNDATSWRLERLCAEVQRDAACFDRLIRYANQAAQQSPEVDVGSPVWSTLWQTRDEAEAPSVYDEIWFFAHDLAPELKTLLALRFFCAPVLSRDQASLVCELIDDPAFATLPPLAQYRLMQVALSNERHLAVPRHEQWAKTIRDNREYNLSLLTRASRMTTLLDESATQFHPAPQTIFAARPYSFGASSIIPFPDTAADAASDWALHTTLSTQGRDIPFTAALSGDFAKHPNTHQLARAISSLPPLLMPWLRGVIIMPRPDENTAMTCGAEGIVRVYPCDPPLTPEQTRSFFLHELGHAVSLTLWNDHGGIPTRWQQAVGADGLSISMYGETKYIESFAEFFMAYVQAQEAKTLDELRRLAPHRCALLDAAQADIARGPT